MFLEEINPPVWTPDPDRLAWVQGAVGKQWVEHLKATVAYHQEMWARQVFQRTGENTFHWAIHNAGVLGYVNALVDSINNLEGNKPPAVEVPKIPDTYLALNPNDGVNDE